MPDRNDQKALHREFNAVEKPHESIESPRLERKLTNTAKAEIENRNRYEKMMDSHIQQWRIERQRLSRVSHNIPEFDLGAREHRNLLSDYGERRSLWEHKADQIDDSFAAEKAQIRDNGQTLKHEFSVRDQDRTKSRSR